MSRINFSIILLCCCLAFAGCGRETHVYTDTKDVEVESISHVVDGDFLVLSAKLVNDDDDSIQHSVYRVLWFDKDGMMIEQTSWRPVIVKGGDPVYIKERSTVPGATEYTVIISNDASR